MEVQAVKVVLLTKTSAYDAGHGTSVDTWPEATALADSYGASMFRLHSEEGDLIGRYSKRNGDWERIAVEEVA